MLTAPTGSAVLFFALPVQPGLPGLRVAIECVQYFTNFCSAFVDRWLDPRDPYPLST